ncbi:MAG TPA: DUF6080 domain-containing protein, partial [Prevotella sp.]
MKRIFQFLRIRREELPAALFLLLILVVLNALMLNEYYAIFTPLNRFYWPLFIHHFHMSGFDPITYTVVSDWSAGYNVYRHPLLAFFMFIPYLVNRGLMELTGINCAIFVMAAIQIFCGLYSFVVLYRILRRIIEIEHRDALLLSFFFFSFAFVMLSAMVPDHFILSLLLLLMALYISGHSMKHHRPLKVWQGIVLFVFTAGTSLNNGLKIFFSGLFVNGRRFFHPRYLLPAVVLPALLLWGFCRWEYATLVWPGEVARHAAKAKKMAERRDREVRKQALRTVQMGTLAAKADTVKPASKPVQKSKKVKQGTPISNGEFMRWTD